DDVQFFYRFVQHFCRFLGYIEAALGAGAAHSEALNFIVNTILAQKPELSAQLTAIGHRIVHGGEKYT
ncbi:hypothetical protein ACUODJ_62660, partial [Escherichia sp. HC-CC]